MAYDAIVVGIGGMGSAAAAHCAMRGARVLGVEQFSRGHVLGSSSGKSRVIRRAYYEDEAYVPLLNRAYELWYELQRLSGEHILHTVGMLTAGYRGSDMVAGAETSARLHDLAIETWEAKDIRARYPAVRVNDDDYGVYEPEGGFLVPELAISAHCAIAEKEEAELRFDTGLVRWKSDGDMVLVELTDGSIVRTPHLILTLGPWFKKTMDSLGVAMRIQRNVAAWFKPSVPLGPREMPVFMLDRRGVKEPFYGFPDVGDGVKGAFHGHGVNTTAETLDRAIDRKTDVDPIAAAFETWAPGSATQIVDAKASCIRSRPTSTS